MKNDFGQEWKGKDYGMAILAFILIIIAVCIPASILLLVNRLTGGGWFKPGPLYWYEWGVMFFGIFAWNVWFTLTRPRRTIPCL